MTTWTDHDTAADPIGDFAALLEDRCTECAYTVGHHPDCSHAAHVPAVGPGPFDEGHRHPLP